ncbi:DHBP synthase RibB-like alpha/beta domain-containing protein [Aspergillus granulosus]|uniref:3,4-dihydroxy-2-butanone 4-phosphate synthase n=1 Tax=Aspergillus granulosus TaxID=176169 RepID=A0ABR4HAN6_9EURO
MPSPTDPALQFDSIEDTIQAFKNGEFIIVLDSQDRENEGDLIIAAESITPAQMAFLVRHTSGLICAPITPEIASKLQLPQMVIENADPKGTAYTVSVDSADPSVTTGISAQDRALACRTLANPSACPDDLRRPGHIIPLQAKSGGVRERKGHTEATVDFCRLAGKQPAGVIAELVEEGEVVEGVAEISGNNGMMRRDGCLRFGRKWGLKVCTIEDLVEYLERTEGPLASTTAAVNGKH